MTAKYALLFLFYNVVLKILKAELTGFIVNGNRSKIEDFPHSVFIYMSRMGSVCGASILNQALLLTAAHCVDRCPRGPCVTAFTGSGNRYNGFVRNVISIRIHEKYGVVSVENDIALLKLQCNLRLGKTVKRIIIMKNPPKYKTAIIAGWGRATQAQGSGSLVLRQTQQRILDREACEDILNKIPIGTFCGRERGYPHSGDSGGALVVKNRTIQIGIVSFKKPGLSPNTEVYTDVSYFYDWIFDNARMLYCSKKKGKQRK